MRQYRAALDTSFLLAIGSLSLGGTYTDLKAARDATDYINILKATD